VAELRFEIVEGPNPGHQFPVTDQFEIGRDPEAGVTLLDGLVSWRHARVTQIGGGPVVEDLGSTNGTFVNGNQIYSPTRLAENDELQVGVTLLQLRSTAQIARQPSAVHAVPAAFASAPPPAAAQAPPGAPSASTTPELDPLLDVHTKAKALTAPLAVLILVVFVALIYLATR
jgi:pSer/pThr/pTyr-binding forkhead associated (FHA) protein